MNTAKKLLAFMLTLMMFASVFALPASAANAPAAPASVTAAQNTSAIKLTWSKVSGATGYRIYYKLPADLSWRTAVSSTTATTHTFKNLPSAQRYTFAIRSYAKSSTGTVWGGYKQLQTATKPAAPKKLTAAQTTSDIQLNWSEVRDVTGYRIYYRPTSTTTWKVAVSTTDDNTHTFSKLASAKKYDFAVRPYIKTSAGVIWGEYKEIGTATKPDTPKNLTSKADYIKKTVTLSWDKVTRADSYRIYHREYGEEAWKVAVNSTSATSHTFKNVADSAYEFAVLALVKTTSGTICGSYRWTNFNMFTPTTTAPPPTSMWYPDDTTAPITLPTVTYPTTTSPQSRRIELTVDNWDDYFEVYEEVDWNKNAFGEPCNLYGITIYFSVKDEYKDRCYADFACEYKFNTTDCEIKYDVNKEEIEILNSSNPRDEHLSTFRGGDWEYDLTFSYIVAKDKQGTIKTEKYNFLGVTRINGYIEIYD